MNILFVVDYYQPRLGYGSYYIPKALAQLGHNVTILTSNYYYPFPSYKDTVGKILGDRKLPPSIKNDNGVTVVRKKMLFEVFTRAIFGGQLEYIRHVNPDIIFVDKTAGFHTIVFSILKPLFKYKLISIDAHLPSGFKVGGNLTFKIMFYLIFRSFFAGLINRRVDRFIAVQEDTIGMMTRYYGVNKRKITHVPLGTDLDLYKFSLSARLKIRKKYGLKKEDFVVIYTGKIIEEKGVHILFSAFNLIAAKHSNLKLLLIGNANKDYELKCLKILNKKYQNRVVWVGFQNAAVLYKYYSAADAGVWPLQESMSMNDAASCGIPFIANHTIGARLRLSNNNAVLYKKGDHVDLARKIEYLYTNKHIRKAMGIRGRKLMEKNFDWKIIASKYLKSP